MNQMIMSIAICVGAKSLNIQKIYMKHIRLSKEWYGFVQNALISIVIYTTGN